jgi:flagellar motor switch protein FliM
VRQLTLQVQQAEIELVAELAKTRLSVRDLMNLRAGDFIELPLREIVQAKVDGVPVMDCRYGTVNGHTAIRVENLLKYSSLSENPTNPLEGKDA